jgi:hypothetical protein
MMFAVVQIFAMISGSVSESRALLEMNDRLRAAKTRLQMDLEGLTVVPHPPRAEQNDGYLEIIEGWGMEPIVSPAPTGTWRPQERAQDSDRSVEDTTVTDFDDVLMFTTRNPRTPFVSMVSDVPVETDVAEVAWFLHGNRLYRRVCPLATNQNLANLTRRENRNQLATRGSVAPYLVDPPGSDPRDFWTREANDTGVILPGSFAPLHTDDVILNNVIGFDVKVFDPLYGDYVDLGYDPASALGTPPTSFSRLAHADDATLPLFGARIYDTWTTSYLEDPADADSASIPPPYLSPLRGIQVRIRVFEPDSRMIREVTVIQDFLPR